MDSTFHNVCKNDKKIRSEKNFDVTVTYGNKNIIECLKKYMAIKVEEK